jgi:hypothetical protein
MGVGRRMAWVFKECVYVRHVTNVMILHITYAQPHAQQQRSEVESSQVKSSKRKRYHIDKADPHGPLRANAAKLQPVGWQTI